MNCVFLHVAGFHEGVALPLIEILLNPIAAEFQVDDEAVFPDYQLGHLRLHGF